MKFTLVNETNQKYQDDKIFFAIIGTTQAGQFCHIGEEGRLDICQDSDNYIPGHIEKNNEKWCNYSRTIKEMREIEVPWINSGRVYISMGEPICFKVKDNGKSFVQPNPLNPSDPNANVYFDWIEFTIDNGGFHGNTTQVDQFGFPMFIQLIGSKLSQYAGINKDKSRSDLFNEYKKTVPDEFKSLVQEPFRIVSPSKGGFASGGQYATYFGKYISDMWQHYTSNELQLEIPQGKFIGKVKDNVFTFTQIDSPDVKCTINYPTSWEVFRCDGVFNNDNNNTLPPDTTAKQLAIQAQIAAMFNRHVLEYPANKCNPEKFYPQDTTANYYAKFWHSQSINNKAYGFPYDDVCEQSTLLEDPHPQELKIHIRWD